MESLGNSQEKAARRPEIDRVKTQMGSDFFKLETEERERKAREIISGFGMQGVDTVDDLFNRTQAPGYNPEKANETLRVLSTAVYENMNENGLSQIPIKGSYTVESMLPKMWVGQDALDPENGSRFASMVTQNFIDKFGDDVSKNRAFAALEMLDYVRNYPGQGVEIGKQTEEAKKEINSILPLGRGAIEAKLMALKCLEGESKSEDGENTEIPKKEKDENINETKEEARRPKTENNENEDTNKDEIPDSKEDQLSWVRQKLDFIESSRNLDDYYTVGHVVAQLERDAENMKIKPEVREEVMTRLKLKHCNFLMGQSGGWIKNPSGGMTMSMAAETAQNRGRALGREDIKFLFNPEGANGMPVAAAWNLMQEASYDYKKILMDILNNNKGLKDSNGNIVTKERMMRDLEQVVDNDPELGNVEVNYGSDDDFERRNWVRKELARRLVNENQKFFKNVDNKKAAILSDKALYLAESLALSTQEIAVWNRGTLKGNNELADMVGIEYYRQSRDKHGRPVGPRFHLNLIKNIGATSWLRYTTTLNGGERIPPGKELKAEEVYKNLDKFSEGGYQYFFSVFVSNKIAPLFELLKQRDPSPKDVNYELLKKAVDYFNKADPRAQVAEIDRSEQIYLPVEIRGNESFVVTKTKDGRTQEIKTEDGKSVFVGGKEYTFNERKNILTPKDKKDTNVINLGRDGKIISEKNDKGDNVEFFEYQGVRQEIKEKPGNKVFLNGKEYPIVLGKNGKQQLRALWLAGVVQMATTNPLLDWNLDNIMELGRMASEQKLSEEAGTFITKRQWNDILRELDAYNNLRKLSKQRRIRGNRSKDFVREA